MLSKSNNTFITNAFKISEKVDLLDYPKISEKAGIFENPNITKNLDLLDYSPRVDRELDSLEFPQVKKETDRAQDSQIFLKKEGIKNVLRVKVRNEDDGVSEESISDSQIYKKLQSFDELPTEKGKGDLSLLKVLSKGSGIKTGQASVLTQKIVQEEREDITESKQNHIAKRVTKVVNLKLRDHQISKSNRTQSEEEIEEEIFDNPFVRFLIYLFNFIKNYFQNNNK